VLAKPWSGDDGMLAARAMVVAFVQQWERHRAVLRTRNLAAQEGDQRFRTVRNASLQPLVDALAERIEDAQQAGDVGTAISPIAAAAALVAMTERVAAFHRELEGLGVAPEALVETTARIIHQTATGRD
jgi:hypothetical protein